MTNVTTKSDSFEPATDTAAHLFDNWFDPIESGVRERVREFIARSCRRGPIFSGRRRDELD
jgi:hypothetical protein